MRIVLFCLLLVIVLVTASELKLKSPADLMKWFSNKQNMEKVAAAAGAMRVDWRTQSDDALIQALSRYYKSYMNNRQPATKRIISALSDEEQAIKNVIKNLTTRYRKSYNTSRPSAKKRLPSKDEAKQIATRYIKAYSSKGKQQTLEETKVAVARYLKKYLSNKARSSNKPSPVKIDKLVTRYYKSYGRPSAARPIKRSSTQSDRGIDWHALVKNNNELGIVLLLAAHEHKHHRQADELSDFVHLVYNWFRRD